MGRGPKYPLSFLDHFQICCPKNPNSLVSNPLPAVTCIFSPVNSKSCDISFPSSPIHPTSHSRRSLKIKSLDDRESRSKSCTKHRMIIDDEFQSSGYSKPRTQGKMKMYNSPVSSDSDENDTAIAYSRFEKKSKKVMKMKSKARFYSSTPSTDSSDETHNLFSSPTRSCSYGHPLNTKTMQQKHIGPRRFKRFGSKEWKDGESAENKPIPERFMPQILVKRSVDPYWDFKRSMLEMIWDQKISDPKEMECLLMSFLSLNSTQHHKVIVEAFSDIWKEMYCGSCN